MAQVIVEVRGGLIVAAYSDYIEEITVIDWDMMIEEIQQEDEGSIDYEAPYIYKEITSNISDCVTLAIPIGFNRKGEREFTAWLSKYAKNPRTAVSYFNDIASFDLAYETIAHIELGSADTVDGKPHVFYIDKGMVQCIIDDKCN